jgi:hypothetical protein
LAVLVVGAERLLRVRAGLAADVAGAGVLVRAPLAPDAPVRGRHPRGQAVSDEWPDLVKLMAQLITREFDRCSLKES